MNKMKLFNVRVSRVKGGDPWQVLTTTLQQRLDGPSQIPERVLKGCVGVVQAILMG